MAYLLDANVFIEAKKRHYGLDFCPAFWDWLIAENAAGRVYSIDEIEDEIHAKADELSAWASTRGRALFLTPDAAVVRCLAVVSAWAASQVPGRYSPAALNAFLQDPDYHLVSHALAQGHTVVTQEITENRRSEIKIPEACLGVGVLSITPFEMLRNGHARFVLGTTTT
jgi:predicted nucleic acid-binding protein